MFSLTVTESHTKLDQKQKTTSSMATQKQGFTISRKWSNRGDNRSTVNNYPTETYTSNFSQWSYHQQVVVASFQVCDYIEWGWHTEYIVIS